MGEGALPTVRIVHVHNPAFQIRYNYGVTMSRRVTAQIGKGLVARYATHIAGTSRQVIGEYGFDASRFGHIPKMALHCGFDTTLFEDIAAIGQSVRRELDWPEDARITLVAGRIDPSPDFGYPRNHKNSGFAVSIGIEAARLDHKVHMIFAGSLTPAVPVLQERIAKAGFAERIKFLGVRNDLKRLMRESDILLFPSRGEGLGMVAVEAQAAGLPVLASTAVPREAIVNITAANQRVTASPFAIENSADALIELYKQGFRT
jgi:glycosyltransferase involved in cell wall biosynthesis